MKKYLYATVIAALLIANASVAMAEHEKRQIKPPSEEVSAIGSLAVAAITFGSSQFVGGLVGLDQASRNFLHAANAFYHLGQWASWPTVSKFAPWTLVAGSAATIVGNPYFLAALKPIPIGGQLADSGEKGKGALLIATFMLLNYGYETVRDLAYNKFVATT